MSAAPASQLTPVPSSRPAAQAPPLTEAWLQAVEAHQPGELDAAVLRVAPLRRSDLDHIRQSLAAVLQPRNADERKRLLRRGALLHTDVAALNHDRNGGYDLPTDAEATIFEDGRTVGQAGGTYHWDFARKLLEQAAAVPDADPDLLLWYHASIADLEAYGDYPEAQAELRVARLTFPRDAVLDVYLGTLHEAFAEPRIQGAVDEMRAASSLHQVVLALPASASTERGLAEAAFKDAIRLDDRQTEAHLRLGRLAGVAGRHEEAIRELLQARAQSPAGVALYYVLLLLGREQASVGRFDDARQAYAAAAGLYPPGVTAHIGLSQVARALGDQGAVEHELSFLSSSPATDPWWFYTRTHEPSAETLLATLRRELSR